MDEPDWANKPSPVPYASLKDPQSLNLYEYVGNNPLSRADADGHVWDWLKKLGNEFTDAQCRCSGAEAQAATKRNRAAAAAEQAYVDQWKRDHPEAMANFRLQIFVMSMGTGPAMSLVGEVEDTSVAATGSAEADAAEATFPSNESQIGHILREAEGHVPDTAENRSLLQSVANDPAAKLGTDEYGNTWSARTLDNGTQAWTQTRGTTIVNAGVNETPRSFNPQTGMKSQ